MHEHVTCKSKDIMGSAHSNPTSIHTCIKVNTHLKMHEYLLKCKCDAMHDDLNSFKQKSTQKFCNNLINFEKPQKLFKNPKLR